MACVLRCTGAVPSHASPSKMYGALHRTFVSVALISEPVASSIDLSSTAAVHQHVKCAAFATENTLSSNNDEVCETFATLTSCDYTSVSLFSPVLLICVPCKIYHYSLVIAVFFTQHYIQ